MNQRSLRTLARALLACSAALAALSAALLWWRFAERREIERLRGELMGEVRLQRELLASQPSDFALYPHVDRDVGFVLNPHLGRSTWNGPPDGRGYPVNSIGLRGEEIGAKAPGATRILIVGDSVVFGWKLADDERLSAAAQAIVDERLPEAGIELLTVALPGWNVRSQRAFLDRHRGLLAPDVIVWKLIGNDVDDVAGVVPPGLLAAWASPHKDGLSPLVASIELHRELPMPAVLERWDANLEAMASAPEALGARLLVVGLNPRRRPFFELLRQSSGLDLPTTFVPAELTDDREAWCVEPPDCHPSAWGARVTAVGLLDKLARLGWIPPLVLEADEERVARAFRDEEARRISRDEVARWAEERLAQVPERFAPGDPGARESALYGLDPESGALGREGVLFLRSGRGGTALELELETGAAPPGAARSALFELRPRTGEGTRLEVALPAERSTLAIPLPAPAGAGVYQLSWRFDTAECSRPELCLSGTLRSARFR